MLYAVLAGFVAALLVPWVHRLSGRHLGWFLSLLPLALLAYFIGYVPEVSGGHVVLQSWAWLPGLDIHLSFLLDGLSLLFALLITFIGFFILIYAGRYLQGHAYLGRFYVILLLFMASMLGLVLSDNLMTLFVFWELTSVTSYLLIGFNHEDKDARKLALQGLLVTVAGGLALMAGIVLLAVMADSYSLSEVLARSDSFQDSPLLTAAMICLLLGAFTKSAQFPFHFWLPNAMAAPTPVSAYLHSATMVKAGVYLMARLNPAFGEQWLWTTLLCSAGAVTMLLGVYLAYSATGIKKVLAYSTIMALGTLTLLIGIGTEYAMVGFAAFLLGHSLYKGALFMLAGALDHATGTKDLMRMGGLRRAMPLTAAAAVIAGLSLAGLPPLLGFVAKELLLEAVLSAEAYRTLLLVVTVLASSLGIAVAASVVLKPFWGALGDTPKTPHETPWPMLLGPWALALVSLLFGVLPGLAGQWLVIPAAQAVGGVPIDTYLSLWHGVNTALLLSGLSLVLGVVLYALWHRSRQGLARLNQFAARVGPEAGYFGALNGLVKLAGGQTRILQNGVMGNYMITLVLTTAVLVGYTLLSQHGLTLALDLSDVSLYEIFIALLMMTTCLYVVITGSRLGAVAGLGVLGFMVALIFIHFSAPDLGITQVLVETLTVILLVLVLFRLPGFARYSTPLEVVRDAVVAICFGAVMTLLILAAIDVQLFETISSYFVEASYPEGKGRNIVNVILVDFRALDTLGEIFVLGIAALGVFSMLRLKAESASHGQ